MREALIQFKCIVLTMVLCVVVALGGGEKIREEKREEKRRSGIRIGIEIGGLKRYVYLYVYLYLYLSTYRKGGSFFLLFSSFFSSLLSCTSRFRIFF